MVSIDIVETGSHNTVLVEVILLNKSTWRTRDTIILSITSTERTHNITEVKGISITSWIHLTTCSTCAIVCRKYFVRINRCPTSLMRIIFNIITRICLKKARGKSNFSMIFTNDLVCLELNIISIIIFQFLRRNRHIIKLNNVYNIKA